MCFSLGVVSAELTKLSRYQKLNRRQQEERKKANTHVTEDTSNCLLKHPPGVAVSLPIAPVIKAKTQGKNIRQNCHHQDARAQEIAMFQGDKAKHQNCTIVHLLTDDELKTMNDKGTIVVHITLSIKLDKTKEKATFWSIINVSGKVNVFSGPCSQK